MTATLDRLKFGDEASIQLAAIGQALFAEYTRFVNVPRRASRRGSSRHGKCGLCPRVIQRGDDVVRVGRSLYHDRCFTAKMVVLKRQLKPLGFIQPAAEAERCI
jgi:hypothetical protein